MEQKLKHITLHMAWIADALEALAERQKRNVDDLHSRHKSHTEEIKDLKERLGILECKAK